MHVLLVVKPSQGTDNRCSADDLGIRWKHVPSSTPAFNQSEVKACGLTTLVLNTGGQALAGECPPLFTDRLKPELFANLTAVTTSLVPARTRLVQSFAAAERRRLQ